MSNAITPLINRLTTVIMVLTVVATTAVVAADVKIKIVVT